jgi:hypothetical protein
MTHSPVYEAIQMGATVRRVADSKISKTGEQKGFTEGVWAGLLGLTKEVPFVDQTFRIDKMFSGPAERQYFLGELAKNTASPQLVQKVANWMDWDTAEGAATKRAPVTVWEHVETGIPGLRQNVPTVQDAAVTALIQKHPAMHPDTARTVIKYRQRIADIKAGKKREPVQ